MVARRSVDTGPADHSASESTQQVMAWLRLRLPVGPDTEAVLADAAAMVEILRLSFNDPVLLQLAALSCVGERIALTELADHFGLALGRLLESVRQLNRVGMLSASTAASKAGSDLETLRRMTLAMAVDIRVVLIRLAHRLQVLRSHADAKTTPHPAIARETLEVLSPLANRLGLWQLKWELEDLAFRILEPVIYKNIAQELEERRVEREQFLLHACNRIAAELKALGGTAAVSSRPKHIYSIHCKMQAKQVPLSRVLDLRGMRIIVTDINACYQALSLVHRIWTPVVGEYDDYIGRPKPNGYQSLHTVVHADDGRALEIQIRTVQMHHAAEFGLASHWAYKEASVGVAGSGSARAADRSQLDWLRQLLAWQDDLGQTMDPPAVASVAVTAASVASASVTAASVASAELESGRRIFVLTPQGRVVELPEHATAVDFAYHVHTDLGHRCRGARVDSQMVPLNTSLKNGQTVEVIVANKTQTQIGPSRDWLNVELGYLRSSRARAKVRQWFNAQQQAQLLSLGRERVERAMQREGKTATSLELIATRLGLPNPDELFLASARDELGPRALEQALRNEVPDARAATLASVALPRSKSDAGNSSAQGSVLVVGVDLLLTQLARCCRPIPPDAICGFVTRGRGISVHRQHCTSLQRLIKVAAERIVETSWGSRTERGRARSYAAELIVLGNERSTLARDLLDACARDRVGVSSLTPTARGTSSRFQLLLEVADAAALEKAMTAIRGLAGVFSVTRATSESAHKPAATRLQ
jgi:GTP pyrophosphokinase